MAKKQNKPKKPPDDSSRPQDTETGDDKKVSFFLRVLAVVRAITRELPKPDRPIVYALLICVSLFLAAYLFVQPASTIWIDILLGSLAITGGVACLGIVVLIGLWVWDAWRKRK